MTSREEILATFAQSAPPNGFLIGAGAGTGLSGKTAISGGADFVVVYNSGRYRMAGRGSLAGLLAYGDANAIVLDMAKEIVPIAKAPVFAGINGTDPFRTMPQFLKTIKEAGYVGVQNFPTVGVFDGIFRENLEGTGMGYGLEVAMMKDAHELGLVTAPYCFTPAEAEAMVTGADVDIVVAHMGLTTSGSVGATAAIALEEAAELCQSILDAARALKPDVLVLAHGGPIATAEDWHFVLNNTRGLDGFLGASSMERLPAELAIRETVAGFKNVGLD